MEKQTTTYMEITGVDVETAKDIALQAWNIKNRNNFITLAFVPETTTVIVRFEKYSDTNIREVVESWGTIVFEEDNTRLIVKPQDLKHESLVELDLVYQKTANPDELVIDIEE